MCDRLMSRHTDIYLSTKSFVVRCENEGNIKVSARFATCSASETTEDVI